jgi:phage/plasmid primase-like uncharacterized protein
MRLADGKPGERFRVDDPDGRWAIWEVLAGDDLALARELGYNSPTVVACVRVGDGRTSHSPRDPDDPPYSMEDPATCFYLARTDWRRV